LEGTLVSAAIKSCSWTCFEWKAERRDESFVILVMGLSEDKDYVEDAPGMRDERLVSTLSNLLPHG